LSTFRFVIVLETKFLGQATVDFDFGASEASAVDFAFD